ncbi:hypothetical protein MVEN_02564400 [Mycena venus]|uniref:Uncharacterized protein n=1 Tax=Mycena venus TaxID=2733690 RepID=A0A8H6U297_9AGAR|nr:hypothetical protein MVEN_02564400 [Mycena venus]
MSPLPSNIVPHILAGLQPPWLESCATLFLGEGGRRLNGGHRVMCAKKPATVLSLCKRPFAFAYQLGTSRRCRDFIRAIDFLPCPAPHPAKNAVHATIRGQPLISCLAPHPAENAVHATIWSRDFVRAVDFLPYPALHPAENAVHATIRLNTISILWGSSE